MLEPSPLGALRRYLRAVWRPGALFSTVGTLLALGSLAASALAAEEIQGAFYWGDVEASEEVGLNLLDDTSATFGWQGRLYHLHATNAPGTPARQVLEAAITELAPGLTLDCFHRWSAGSWADLAAAGLGDPRPAVPPSFSPTELRLLYYARPAVRCAGWADAPNLPVQLSVGFEQPGGRRLEVRADWGDTAAGGQPGQLSDLGAAWKSGHLTFSVAFDGPGLGTGVVTAIARALDLWGAGAR